MWEFSAAVEASTKNSADYTRYISSTDVYCDEYETATIHNEEYGQHT